MIKEEFVWWKHGVIYHIYPRSFYDSNSDGIGDLQGIIQKLDYLDNLGIDAIWLSPIYESPLVDFGYDVSDYRAISCDYGSMSDFTELLAKAHERGIKVIMDLIMNHTSNQHPWFIESSSSLTNPKRDWYIWEKGDKGKTPNNWKSAIGNSAWEYDFSTKQYYLHSFFKEQPDLNWRNEEMHDAFFNEVRFWLEKGVDGFRLDVINFIVKDKKLRDNPMYMGIQFLQKHIYNRNRPKSYKIVKKLRKLIDEYDNKMLLGEVYVMPPGDSAMAASYCGKKGLNLAFDFSLIFKKWDARAYYECIKHWYKLIPKNGWACNVLSNHDLSRSFNRSIIGGYNIEKAKVAAVLLLTIKGTPFIYYGEEIGMENGKIKRKDIKDPLGKKFWPFYSGRDKARTPMQWSNDDNAGFTKAENPWLPINNDYLLKNIEIQTNIEDSILNIYKKIIQIRKRHPALTSGDWMPVMKGKHGILAYYRVHNDEQLLVILNFTNEPKQISIDIASGHKILFSTHKIPHSKTLNSEYKIAPFEALIMETIDA